MHLVAAAFVLGGVFMNVFIVWPAAKATLGRSGFPLEFLVEEGRRIAPWLYFGLGMIFLTRVAGLLLAPPVSGAEWSRVVAQAVAWSVMLLNTLHGTRRLWPAMQFSVGDEGWAIWPRYVRRGQITFGCALVVFVLSASRP